MVETLRKPSTGLKPFRSDDYFQADDGRDTQKTQHGIETPSRPLQGLYASSRRDTQKTQHGIETVSRDRNRRTRTCSVETLRKPSTGLKPSSISGYHTYANVETLRKPSTGLKRCGELRETESL